MKTGILCFHLGTKVGRAYEHKPNKESKFFKKRNLACFLPHVSLGLAGPIHAGNTTGDKICHKMTTKAIHPCLQED